MANSSFFSPVLLTGSNLGPISQNFLHPQLTNICINLERLSLVSLSSLV
jgi:hypothetical protein